MKHVRLAATTLVLCGANAMAQEIGREDTKPLATDVSFASASGIEIRTAPSPLGSLSFGQVPARPLDIPAEPPLAAEKGVKVAAFPEEETAPGGRADARPVPEPPTLLMLMAGLGALAVVISRRQ
ncbi:PEP-CTERM sorting domain-containing protein [Ideonella sp. YS5]|uniref:PEP-CTERM sorting domain-containing protein n=1 Tax=Ideonella sp. YS5 TaxID=3453714 RepID=UPI003EECFFF2